jgi:hypothetical protein
MKPHIRKEGKFWICQLGDIWGKSDNIKRAYDLYLLSKESFSLLIRNEQNNQSVVNLVKPIWMR